MLERGAPLARMDELAHAGDVRDTRVAERREVLHRLHDDARFVVEHRW
jgi:hypothetical protein